MSGRSKLTASDVGRIQRTQQAHHRDMGSGGFAARAQSAYDRAGHQAQQQQPQYQGQQGQQGNQGNAAGRK